MSKIFNINKLHYFVFKKIFITFVMLTHYEKL
jgi:hypothetical protein